MNKTHQKGGILFIVMIAVILFAALTYAVTSSTGGNGKNVDAEKAAMQANEILNYGQSISMAINRLMTSKGCTLQEISFYSDNSKMGSHAFFFRNNNSPTNRSCDVFHAAGGGAIYIPHYPGLNMRTGLSDLERYYNFISRGQIWGVGRQHYAELRMVAASVTDELCKAYNKITIGQEKIFYAGNGTVADRNATYKGGSFILDGVYDSHAAIGMPSGSPELYGQPNACAAISVGGYNTIYYTLLER